MSVIALVTGKLLKTPTTRPGKNGDRQEEDRP